MDKGADGWQGGYMILNKKKYCKTFTSAMSSENAKISADTRTTKPKPIRPKPTKPKKPSQSCDAKVREVELETKTKGSHAYWKITKPNHWKRLCSGRGKGDNRKKSFPCCLAPGTYTVKCYDFWGRDGWQGASLKIGNKTYCEDFTSGMLKKVDATIEE